MKNILRLAALLALAPLALGADVAPIVEGVTGRYVEARTASVYAGACHYGSEYTTAGREAVLAWRFDAGTVDGESLAGVTLVATVASDRNLAAADGAHRSVVHLPKGLADERRDAALAWARATHGAMLGEIVAVRESTLAFRVEDETFDLRVDDTVRLSGRLMADRECCSMPHNVWYRPFDRAIAAPVVGGVDEFRCRSAELERSWVKRDANCVFYGRFGEPVLPTAH
jgi:hypothetical protein